MRVPGLRALALALSVGAVIAPAKAQEPPCARIFDIELSTMRTFCGSEEQFARAIAVCAARYDALTDRERNSPTGRALSARCSTLRNANNVIGMHRRHEADERNRIEDARRRLRALGAEP
jgi:hypothetical protein